MLALLIYSGEETEAIHGGRSATREGTIGGKKNHVFGEIFRKRKIAATVSTFLKSFQMPLKLRRGEGFQIFREPKSRRYSGL